MTSVGLVGGLGPESTIDYYRRIMEAWHQVAPGTSPSIVIDSLDVQTALRLVASDRKAFAEYLLGSLNRLAAAGVSFAAMTANTPHIVFDELASKSSVPLVSIVETCAAEAERLDLSKLLLLGTRFTMEASFYREAFARRGVTVTAPDDADRTWVHERYVKELLEGDFRDTTREEFKSLIERLRDDQHIDGVILGGTELPLLLSSSAVAGIPVLDTTALHVAAIAGRLRSESGSWIAPSNKTI